MSRQFRLLIGVIGNDIHIVANIILARGLRQSGYAVCNIGVNSTPLDFVAASVEFEADVVIVSSINGEAEGWVSNLRLAFNAAGQNKILLYIGGNLAVGNQPKKLVEQRYIEFGFDRAYHQPPNFDVLFDDLATDLQG
jgi:methylaspartate mutase sigma subunit